MSNVYSGSPLLVVLALLGIVATIYAVRAFIGYRVVAADAKSDWDYRHGRLMIPRGLDQDGFLRAYTRVNNPRHLLFTALAVSVILLATPVIFVALDAILNFFYNQSRQSRVIEPGFLVWQFLLFICTIGAWAGIGYLFASFYHSGTPGNLEREMNVEIEKRLQA